MISIKETTIRYNVTSEEAKKVLDRVEEEFSMDWSEMSWGQIDKRMKATMKILGIKAIKAKK